MRAVQAIVWKLRFVGVVVIIALAALAGWQRSRLLASYYAFRLDRADAELRETWESRLIALDAAATPSLLARLTSQNSAACSNAFHCLNRLVAGWPRSDRRRAGLIVALGEEFGQFTVQGKVAALQIALTGLPEKMSTSQLRALASLLSAAAAEREPAIHAEALTVAEKCLNPAAGAELNEAIQSVARNCLKDDSAETRLRAVRFLTRRGSPVLPQVLVALRDPAAEVRRAALLGVGPLEDLLATDELLSWLHDPDPKVARICEEALRARGLEDRHLRLARLITDPRPTVRLQVLDQLMGNAELEPGAWLRRLSYDTSPAVRAAAMRAAAEQPLADLTDRIDQMSQNDPSPTIRQLAKFYLSARKGK